MGTLVDEDRIMLRREGGREEQAIPLPCNYDWGFMDSIVSFV